ncbi:MAG: polyprenyl synthetase family protein [Proteobacteria bacterium]|nr:polyprenyl synthetase family protein [Pseudomonadota bacterium]
MDAGERIEQALELAVGRAEAENGPPQLAAAIRHAVFSGGARVRPRLTLAVAEACGGDEPAIADAAAAAIEMLHCASLVHDDLPCFDNADTRRGRPSVHALYGAPLALLAGDALIVMAFETLGRSASGAPQRLVPLIATVTRGVGAPFGIVAGQAWESEPNPPPEQYRCAKTGALFVAATMSGALASGGDPAPWRSLGHRLGEAYQVADDLLDAVSTKDEGGKPVGQDVALGRPNAVAELGIAGAVERLEMLVESAISAIPSCPGENELRELVRMQAVRLAPKRLLRCAA